MRENSRIKTLSGFDFSFQPSLDRERILTLAQLGFVVRHEVVHFLGPPGTGKSHLATGLGVEAVKADRSVYFCTLADLLGQLARAEREGRTPAIEGLKAGALPVNSCLVVGVNSKGSRRKAIGPTR